MEMFFSSKAPKASKTDNQYPVVRLLMLTCLHNDGIFARPAEVTPYVAFLEQWARLYVAKRLVELGATVGEPNETLDR